ncbi:MAG: hypothetical protein PHR56_05190 [Dehalococcoidales bacterium]|nr:hypothetical protein [Dehalococcoidales bacterium]
MSETVLNVILIIVILGLMVANFFVRKAKMERSALGRVVTVLDELRYNEKLTGAAATGQKIKKFRTKRWMSNQYKIDFVPTEIVKKLTKAYEAIVGINVQLDRAIKTGADIHLVGVDPASIKGTVTDAQFELREWLRTNMDNPALQPKNKGILGSLFGGGGGLFGGKR